MTSEGLSRQIYLLRETLTKSHIALDTTHNIACTTLCMLEAYNSRNPVRSGHEQCLVLNISNNLDEAQAAYKSLNIPETHICSTVMYHLSKAFGKLLNNLFESSGEEEPGHDVHQSGAQVECPARLSCESHSQREGTTSSTVGQLGDTQVHLERHDVSTVDLSESDIGTADILKTFSRHAGRRNV